MIPEILGVDSVERLEILEIPKEDGRFDHLPEIRPGRTQNSAEIFEYTPCADLEIALDELTGSRVEGNLAAEVSDAVVDDGL